MSRRLPRLAAFLFAGAVMAACGDRDAGKSAARDEPVTTQTAADAVAADIAEDVNQATAKAREEAREGAAVVGRELEQAGDEAREATALDGGARQGADAQRR